MFTPIRPTHSSVEQAVGVVLWLSSLDFHDSNAETEQTDEVETETRVWLNIVIVTSVQNGCRDFRVGSFITYPLLNGSRKLMFCIRHIFEKFHRKMQEDVFMLF